MRIAFDSNVLVAALHTRGLCADLVVSCLQSHRIVVSEYILAEIERTMLEKFKTPREIVGAVMTKLRLDVDIVEPTDISANACRDHSDLPVLGTAVAGKCEYLVTGDPNLQVLKKYNAIKIISPRELVTKLQS